MNNYDLRQIRLMYDKITLYKNGKIKLNFLIDDLRALFDILKEDYPWRKDFHEAWFTLEQAYAVSLSNNEPISKYQSYIDEGIADIEGIIDPIIKENKEVDAYE